MRTVHEWLRRHATGLPKPQPLTLSELDSQRSVAPDALFEQLCLNRRRMGFLRYESVLGVDQVGYLRRAKQALADYERTGNREYLIDASNYVRREWLDAQLDYTYFEGTDHPESEPSDD